MLRETLNRIKNQWHTMKNCKSHRCLKLFCLFITALIITGCSSNNAKAPIIEGWKQGSSKEYIVQKGDTLYPIAWAFDADYRDLATLNHLTKPYCIKAGQKLLMFPEKTTRSLTVQKISTWGWPAQGKITTTFAPNGGNKGINIAGKTDSPVLASADGVIVYSGNGLRSYGELIIIKHNSSFLSAYAYNKNILIKEGQKVKKGQQIATMGQKEGNPLLHFEIRCNGEPVDPLRFLHDRSNSKKS